MTGRLALGWQTTIADLALILFLVVSAAPHLVSSGPDPSRSFTPATPSVAVYRPSAALSVGDWLNSQLRDERLTVTVLVEEGDRSSSSSPSPALANGQALMDEIARGGRRVRMIVERAAADDVSVIVAYDQNSGTPLAAEGA